MNPPTTPSDAGSSVQNEPLLPCPFCGEQKAKTYGHQGHHVHCPCGAQIDSDNGTPGVRIWNQRVTAPSVQNEPGKPERYTLGLKQQDGKTYYPDIIYYGVAAVCVVFDLPHGGTLESLENRPGFLHALARAKGIVAALNAHARLEARVRELEWDAKRLEAAKKALRVFEDKERGIVQAHMAAQLIHELRAAIDAATQEEGK